MAAPDKKSAPPDKRAPKKLENPEDKGGPIKAGSRQERFLAQSVILEESGLSKLVRWAALLISTSVLAFMLWAAFAVMDEVAQTTGEIAPSGPVEFIQHLEGGIIEEILVDLGQLVNPGDPIIKLVAKDAIAEYNQLRSREAGLMLKVAGRLALLSGEPLCDYSDRALAEDARKNDQILTSPCSGWKGGELAGTLGLERIFSPEFRAAYPHLISEAISLLDSQRRSKASQLAVIRTQIQQKRAKVAKLRNQATAYKEQIAFQNAETQIRSQLASNQRMSKLALLSAQQSRANTRADLYTAEGDMRLALTELAESRQKMLETQDKLHQDTMRELEATVTELSQVRATLPRLQDRIARLTVRANVKGLIKELAVKNIGGVVSPGGQVAELVPFTGMPRAEVRITPKDVGHVKLNQPVTVKVATYDYARYGGVTGYLASVSPSTFLDEKTGQPYYKGVVQLEKDYIGENPSQNQLKPGMTITASIHTGAKTLLEYILKPIHSSMDDSFRER
ncbi:HlyD family type I secretion periplasmic adaptor subunit [Magnetofaba australis]|uniref:Membrane fusion protein (MFP) family protein n=1 Tax=Magnetofaba australis IT-1 TaxID=1434232 RepID=A0A1Y2K291_9PROT|nr:HlyD family type I secretion periplasmic adaptor subunit [Magnetofaba australis]OSM01777.1 putative HlyD family type I secretion membrane fusion protein [Magnetofaba australis IT-1]